MLYLNRSFLIYIRQLTSRLITSLHDAFDAINLLQSLGTSIVIITSLQIPSMPTSLYLCASINPSINNTQREPMQFTIQFPRIDGAFTGTGDLFATLLTSYLLAETRESNVSIFDGTALSFKR